MTSRNARFQQWQAILSNRHKRQRASEFIVQGVRPISLAIEHRWPVNALLFDADGSLSRWAHEVLGRVEAQRFSLATELIQELGGKSDEVP